MAIFNSYVSLPEGRKKKGLGVDWKWLKDFFKPWLMNIRKLPMAFQNWSNGEYSGTATIPSVLRQDNNDCTFVGFPKNDS